jgi:hypothetical protein
MLGVNDTLLAIRARGSSSLGIIRVWSKGGHFGQTDLDRAERYGSELIGGRGGRLAGEGSQGSALGCERGASPIYARPAPTMEKSRGATLTILFFVDESWSCGE